MFTRNSLAPRVSFALAFGALVAAGSAAAQSFDFTTGNPDGKNAIASRPEGEGLGEVESADDFLLAQETLVRQATFTGLLPTHADLSDVEQVVVEIYRVFPLDSALPPDGRVPTRNNSPSDLAFSVRDSAAKELAAKLTFEAEVLADDFGASTSVVDRISVNSHGDGAATGEVVQFSVAFPKPFDLPAGHYFFVPQVKLSSGTFQWLSAPRPIVAPGVPFLPDLQTWIRNEALSPDWLRVGADIIGGAPAPAFNGSFSLHGSVVKAAN